MTKIFKIIICNLKWILTQKYHLKLLLLNLLSKIQKKKTTKNTRTSKMELLTKLGFEKSNQAKRDQSKHCNKKVFENLKRKVFKANESGLNSVLKA